ncbi:MAG: FtsX-like permease family protein, partial [Acidimicrobiales bacterium]|nr:FtsX-like permease family protein [Acidimicrobiales bacterium]
MSWRLPARLARREVARRRGRTALVVLLVALPVAGMAVAFTLQRTGERTGLEEWREQYGDFDAVTYPSLDGAEPTLPEGSSVVVVRTGSALLRLGVGGRTFADVTDLPAGDRRLRAATEQVEGRAPRTAGEIALSPELAGALDVGVGDRLELDQPEVSAEVVGLAEQTTCLSCHRIIFAPGQDTLRRDDPGTQLLIDLPRMLAPGQRQQLEAVPNIDLRSRWAAR